MWFGNWKDTLKLWQVGNISVPQQQEFVDLNLKTAPLELFSMSLLLSVCL